MSWRDLIEERPTTRIVPWFGSDIIYDKTREYRIVGRKPEEFGWYEVSLHNRDASFIKKADFPNTELLTNIVSGFLVGDRIIIDDSSSLKSASDLLKESRVVKLIEPGIEKFSRISVGQFQGYGPFIFNSQEMPLGPESDVYTAWMNKAESISNIPGVTPALEAVFKIENHRREVLEARRAEAERLRREEEERIRREEERTRLYSRLGDATSRRLLATTDFEAAARAALAISGSELVEVVNAYQRNEKIVRFRMHGRIFECICDSQTLQIIEAGVCLTDEDTGEKGDTWLTLESLPVVIAEAESIGRLVVFRHVYQ